MYYNMRKILLFVLLFLVACGGAEVESTISQDFLLRMERGKRK